MPNKIKFCSVGFFVLLGSIALSVFYVNWAFTPLAKEKAHVAETKGRILFLKNKPQEAHEYFLEAAEFHDVAPRKSIRYQWAGETSNSLIGKIYYFRQAYKLNPDDDFFMDQVRETPILNALILEDQSMNDMTLEEWREKALAMWPDSIEEIFAMYAETPGTEEVEQQVEKTNE